VVVTSVSGQAFGVLTIESPGGWSVMLRTNKSDERSD